MLKENCGDYRKTLSDALMLCSVNWQIIHFRGEWLNFQVGRVLVGEYVSGSIESSIE